MIASSLPFGEYISSKTSNANRNLGLILRTFTFMDKEMFLNLYKSLVRPHLEYAISVWSPLYIYKKRCDSYETVQRRAPRSLSSLKNKTCTDRLKFLGFPTLEYGRDRADMTQVYKVMNDIDKIDRNKMFTMADYTGTRGHPLKISIRRFTIFVEISLAIELPMCGMIFLSM